MMQRHTRALGWGLAVLVACGFTLLGGWQLQRMQAKQARLDGAVAAGTLAPVALADALARDGLVQVEDHGRFLPGVVLLDNQIRRGRAGVKVYRPFQSEAGARVLVDLGWRPLPPDRALPFPATAPTASRIRGLLAPPPSPGLAIGPAVTTAGPGRWLATRLLPADLGPVMGVVDLPMRVLRLDPSMPFGDVRDLDLLPNTLPPQRHLGYAVQWFGLALAVLVVALVMDRRRLRPT